MKEKDINVRVILVGFMLILPLVYYWTMFGSFTFSKCKEDIKFFYEYVNNLYTPLLSIIAAAFIYLTYKDQSESNKVLNNASVYNYIKDVIIDFEKWIIIETDKLKENRFNNPIRLTPSDFHEILGGFRIFYTLLKFDSRKAIYELNAIEEEINNFSSNRIKLQLYKVEINRIMDRFEALNEALINTQNLFNDKDRINVESSGLFVENEKDKWLREIEGLRTSISSILEKYKYQ